MTIDELIAKLEELKKKKPKLADQQVMIVLDEKNNDKNIFIALETVSWCYSKGEKPSLEAKFTFDENYN